PRPLCGRREIPREARAEEARRALAGRGADPRRGARARRARPVRGAGHAEANLAPSDRARSLGAVLPPRAARLHRRAPRRDPPRFPWNVAGDAHSVLRLEERLRRPPPPAGPDASAGEREEAPLERQRPR